MTEETRSDLLKRVPERLRDSISFVLPVLPWQLPMFIAKHDIGLAIEDPSIRNRDLTITNKILQYMNAGLGIVASDTKGQREALSFAPGAGLICDLHKTTEFSAQIDALLGDPARIDAMGRSARRAAEETYCWEKQSLPLIEKIDTILSAPQNLA